MLSLAVVPVIRETRIFPIAFMFHERDSFSFIAFGLASPARGNETHGTGKAGLSGKHIIHSKSPPPQNVLAGSLSQAYLFLLLLLLLLLLLPLSLSFSKKRLLVHIVFNLSFAFSYDVKPEDAFNAFSSSRRTTNSGHVVGKEVRNFFGKR